ncbi:MAG: flavin reductase family protein [Rhizobiaceae bacterium]
MTEADASNGFDYRALRNAFGSFATGVTIITARGEGSDNNITVGLTANSFSSVSLNPALVSWSLASHAPSLSIFQNCTHYAIHVLRDEQKHLAERFAQSRDDKFNGLGLKDGLGGAPILADSLAVFQCQNAHRYTGGDHIIFLGQVEKFDCNAGRPLVFHAGKFGDLAEMEH